jgi:type I restriction enzyme S subunit
MRSNYKKLGGFIQEVNIRDSSLKVDLLLGVSIQKKFIPSIANTIGTDMSTYKIIKKNQFAYGPVTSRNGDKISIALLEDEEAIISQAYKSFEVKDPNQLDPEYLMMWFRRPEFDRYARFMSHGSAREIFDWDQICEMELPMPSIEKQREIVREYKVIQDRINLNNELIQKLEETAQSVYKRWFVEFEFPVENSLNSPQLVENAGQENSPREGWQPQADGVFPKTYKSSGGEMVWCEELGKEVPIGWELQTVEEFCLDMISGGTPSRNNLDYWNSGDIPWLKTGEVKNNIILSTEECISNEGLKNSSAKLLPKDTVLMSMYGVNAGEIGILKFEATTNQACCGMICTNPSQSAYLYFHLLENQEFIASQSIGGAQENLSKNFIENIKIIKPIDEILNSDYLKIFIDNKETYTRQSQKLSELKDLLLSRLAGGVGGLKMFRLCH